MDSLPSRDIQKIRRILSRVPDMDEPLRIALLRSRLPVDYRMNLFRQLTCDSSDKTEALTRSALQIPYGVKTPIPKMPANDFLKRSYEIMESEITGHAYAKREVMSMLSQWHSGGRPSFAIALEGAPGTGKTTFVKHALAAAVGRPMEVICLGGASDQSLLVGHGFTYDGARPGELVKSLQRAKCNDPVLFFDELDKISDTARGDELVNTLVHLTDPVMNSSIRDRYFQGLDLDFSRCIMVFSMNDPSKVSPILLDRIKRIQMDTPSVNERCDIAERHIVPRLTAETRCPFSIPHDVVDYIVHAHKDMNGMRAAERSIQEVLAAAVLCKNYGCKSVVGLEKGSIDTIDIAFARHVLQERMKSASPMPAPPPMMYT